MNLNFLRRRDVEDFAEAIRPELVSLSSPEPRKELLARILASREAGARIILPEVQPEPTRPRLRFVVAAAAIAAVMLLVVVPREPPSDGSADDMWASPNFLGNAAFGQTISDAPKLPRLSLVRAGTLRPISVQFARRYRDSKGTLTREVSGDVSLMSAVVNGESAWKIISLDRNTTAQGFTIAETLYVARSDLRLLARAVHVSPYRRFQRINIQQRFLGTASPGE